MSKNVDLTSKEWCDLVFEGKNKAFGGYLLRVNSPKRYTWATIGVICVVAFAFVLPYIVESFKFFFVVARGVTVIITGKEAIACGVWDMRMRLSISIMLVPNFCCVILSLMAIL